MKLFDPVAAKLPTAKRAANVPPLENAETPELPVPPAAADPHTPQLFVLLVAFPSVPRKPPLPLTPMAERPVSFEPTMAAPERLVVIARGSPLAERLAIKSPFMSMITWVVWEAKILIWLRAPPSVGTMAALETIWFAPTKFTLETPGRLLPVANPVTKPVPAVEVTVMFSDTAAIFDGNDDPQVPKTACTML